MRVGGGSRSAENLGSLSPYSQTRRVRSVPCGAVKIDCVSFLLRGKIAVKNK